MGQVQAGMKNKRVVSCEDGSRYVVGEMLGSGSYADVCKVQNMRTSGHFAIKITKRKGYENKTLEELGYYTRQTKKQLGKTRACDINERDIHEMRIMEKLSHPSILKCFTMAVEIDNIGMILEYVDGCDLLEKTIQKKCYNEMEAKVLLTSLCDAMKYMHSKGIVHRDLKPENILVSRNHDTQIKIADFGLSASLPSSGEKKLRQLCGSPSCVAPEMLRRQPYDELVDMWAVGVLAFEIMTGNGLFRVKKARGVNLKLLSNGTFHRNGTYWCGVSKLPRSFISGLLQVDPAQRMSAEEALDQPWLSDSTRDSCSGSDVHLLDDQVMQNIALKTRQHRRTRSPGSISTYCGSMKNGIISSYIPQNNETAQADKTDS